MSNKNIIAYTIVALIFCAICALSIINGEYLPFIACLLLGLTGYLTARNMAKSINQKTDRILFCDLDGTLIKTASGATFPIDGNDWEFRSAVIIAIYNYAPTAIHIISNQGGIEKGFVNHHDFINKMLHITTVLKDELGIPVTFDYCQYNDPAHPYRKPNPGMITNYLNDMSVSTSHCLMIGDASGLEGQFSDSDLRCAENAGISYQDVDDFVKEYNPASCL